MYMDLFFFKFFLHIVITEYLAEFPVLHSRSLLSILNTVVANTRNMFNLGSGGGGDGWKKALPPAPHPL